MEGSLVKLVEMGLFVDIGILVLGFYFKEIIKDINCSIIFESEKLEKF